MKKASGFYADSLEMLLDTMCNVLGGIVFLTLTLAQVVSNTPPPPPDYQQNRTDELTRELSAVTTSTARVEEEIQQVTLRLQESHQRIPTNQMRLPNLTGTLKDEWQVIVRYGKLYPVARVSPGAQGTATRNLQTIEWRSVRGRVELEPKPEAGDDPESGVAAMVQAFRRSLKTNFYFTFFVYEDSFAAFARAREAAVGFGSQYGWEPLRENEPLPVGRRGEKTLPQN